MYKMRLSNQTPTAALVLKEKTEESSVFIDLETTS